ncbi:hypothetical protein SAMN05414139_01481 [Burkholderia sp. D7]|nr:hypothetical protein SAMN05414139_01481 [Burkholderia sp. D7]
MLNEAAQGCSREPPLNNGVALGVQIGGSEVLTRGNGMKVGADLAGITL